jgi:hypothetical protein
MVLAGGAPGARWNPLGGILRGRLRGLMLSKEKPPPGVRRGLFSRLAHERVSQVDAITYGHKDVAEDQ